MVMEMCLVGFLETFSVKIFSQTNQKMKTIKFRFQCFQFLLFSHPFQFFPYTSLSLSFFLLSTDNKPNSVTYASFSLSITFFLSKTSLPHTSLRRSYSTTPPPLLRRTTTAATPFPVDNLLVRFASCLLFSPFFASGVH